MGDYQSEEDLEQTEDGSSGGSKRRADHPVSFYGVAHTSDSTHAYSGSDARASLI